MKVRCPECGSKGELSADLAEQMVRCPQCGGTFPAHEDLEAWLGVTWFYALEDEKKGPVSETEFADLIGAGVITPDTLVWSKGMTGWLSLAEVRGKQTMTLAQEEPSRKMKVRCPDCGRRGQLSTELLGQMVRCPQCGGHSQAEEELEAGSAGAWYYADGNEKRGPLSEAEFTRLIGAGSIAPETLVWRKGMSGWQTLAATRDEHTVILAEAELPQSPETTVAPAESVFPPEAEPVADGQLAGWANLAYAGGGKRLVAKLIDFIFMFAWASLVEGLSRKLFPEAFDVAGDVNSVYMVTMFICFLLGMFYITWFVGRFGATPGKMVMNLKVVTPAGGRVNYSQAFGRYWAEFLIVALSFTLGYLPILIDSQRRGLHDRLSGTRVVTV
ncbi:MAG: DUF4339 domain-containing protein [Desulfobulbaceae bacterium]|nr:DUF4339 domain-containing protein [Desulfobulbaceae bacterium]